MLEVSPSLTTSRARLEVHPLGIGGKDDPVRLVFTADLGPAVVVALSDMRDRFRLVANVVENVPLPEPMPNLPVGHAVWRPAPDFRTSATCWLTAGAAHHTVMSTAVGIDVFREFARIARVEFLAIDEDTTVRGFEDEVRWNAADSRAGCERGGRSAPAPAPRPSRHPPRRVRRVAGAADRLRAPPRTARR
jgi:L-arabinose isomerase